MPFISSGRCHLSLPVLYAIYGDGVSIDGSEWLVAATRLVRDTMEVDEPLAGIDPIALNDIRNLIGQLKEHGLGVLITDHNVRETLDIVDRAYIIYDGSVLMEGTPDEVIGHQAVREVYLGDRFSI